MFAAESRLSTWKAFFLKSTPIDVALSTQTKTRRIHNVATKAPFNLPKELNPINVSFIQILLKNTSAIKNFLCNLCYLFSLKIESLRNSKVFFIVQKNKKMYCNFEKIVVKRQHTKTEIFFGFDVAWKAEKIKLN